MRKIYAMRLVLCRPDFEPKVLDLKGNDTKILNGMYDLLDGNTCRYFSRALEVFHPYRIIGSQRYVSDRISVWELLKIPFLIVHPNSFGYLLCNDLTRIFNILEGLKKGGMK